MATFYQTSSKIGVNLNGTTTDANFTLGDKCQGTDNTTWVYVQANGAIEAYDVVSIDEDFQCTPATVATAMAGDQLGFAQIAFADNEYGWVPINGGGNLLVTVSAHSTLNTVLYIGTVSGHLSTTASSATLVGIAIQTASSTSTNSTPECVITWPRVGGTSLGT